MNSNYGSAPPNQQITGQNILDNLFFVTESDWERVTEECFDYIVVGSGLCALAFVERMYQNNPKAKILILERGSFFLPEHFQNMPLPFQKTLGPTESFPWNLSPETTTGSPIKLLHGMRSFFGGKSTLWSGWCVKPTVKEMEGWPAQLIETTRKYCDEAAILLNSIPANQIGGNKNCEKSTYNVLQKKLYERLSTNLDKIPSATRVIHTSLAMGAPDEPDICVKKFAVPGPLLEIFENHNSHNKRNPLRIALECVVKRILQDDNNATALETSRGTIHVGNAKVILAMGTIPPTTLVLNSFPSVKNAGKRFTAHFISSITARVPRKEYPFNDQLNELELAAIYLAGENKETNGQYHVQITGISDKNPGRNAKTAQRCMPDVITTASKEQLLSSTDHVVFACAALGELLYNENNWVCKNDDQDLTANVTLQVQASGKDLLVWDEMDQGTFQALEHILSNDSSVLEYWHENSDGRGEWKLERPSTEQIRVPGLVHEGSTLWIGDNEAAPVDLQYKLNGIGNVYVTGGSLWPRSGSWNPTLAMVGMSQHLADNLCKDNIWS